MTAPATRRSRPPLWRLTNAAVAGRAVEVTGAQQHHDRARQGVAGEPREVLAHGDDRVRPVVLERVGAVGVTVQQHQLVRRARDQPDQVARTHVPDRGRQRDPSARPARGRRFQHRADGSVDVHARHRADRAVVGVVGAVGGVGREVQHADRRDRARARERVEDHDLLRYPQPRSRVRSARDEHVVGVICLVGESLEGGVRVGHERDVEHGDLPGQRARGGQVAGSSTASPPVTPESGCGRSTGCRRRF